MEEDNIKDIFKDFEPELTSDSLFMSQLQGKIKSVELIHQHNATLAKQRRIALGIAAVAGFIVGFLFSFAVPHLGNTLRTFQIATPSIEPLMEITHNYILIVWLLIGAISVFISLNTYDLTLSLLKNKTSLPKGKV